VGDLKLKLVYKLRDICQRFWRTLIPFMGNCYLTQ